MDQHLVVLVASLATLGLAAAIYYTNRLAAPSSRLRSDMLASILLACLVGLYPIAFFAPLAGVWEVLRRGGAGLTFGDLGSDLVSFSCAIAILLILRSLVRANARSWRGPSNVTPLTPTPPRRTGAKYTLDRAA